MGPFIGVNVSGSFASKSAPLAKGGGGHFTEEIDFRGSGESG